MNDVISYGPAIHSAHESRFPKNANHIGPQAHHFIAFHIHHKLWCSINTTLFTASHTTKQKINKKANWNRPSYKNLHWCNLTGSHIKYLPRLKIYLCMSSDHVSSFLATKPINLWDHIKTTGSQVSTAQISATCPALEGVYRFYVAVTFRTDPSPALPSTSPCFVFFENKFRWLPAHGRQFILLCS